MVNAHLLNFYCTERDRIDDASYECQFTTGTCMVATTPSLILRPSRGQGYNHPLLRFIGADYPCIGSGEKHIVLIFQGVPHPSHGGYFLVKPLCRDTMFKIQTSNRD